jgi:hypothetical protein
MDWLRGGPCRTQGAQGSDPPVFFYPLYIHDF